MKFARVDVGRHVIAGLYFTYALVALALVVNALRRPTPPSHRLPPLWLFGMITSEAAGLWVLVVPAVSALAFLGGALASAVGRLGLVVAGVAWVGQLEVWRRSRSAARTIGRPVLLPESFFRRLVGLPADPPPDVERTQHVLAPHPHRPGSLEMDLYRRRDATGPQPLVVFVHGGGWRGGHRRQTSQVTLAHLARQGWTVAAIDYPLSPEATFPDHLIGIDAALAWAAATPEVTDPVVLMGASAGAHLAAVAALSRPGVGGLIGLYGIYDFLNRHGTRVNWPVIPRAVMKTTPDEDPELYRLASPLDLVSVTSPPTLLIAGDYDSLVHPDETRTFAGVLEQTGVDVTLLEVPWGQHAFDALSGPRARAIASRIAEWLDSRLQGERDGETRRDHETR